MLQYRRRNRKTTLVTQDFGESSAEFHIDLDTLQHILRSFNEKYIPFYLRIFNETPTKTVEEFLKKYKIPNSSFLNISIQLRDNGFRVKGFFNVK